MSKSNTVDVYVALPHGIILNAIELPPPPGLPPGVGFAYDSNRIALDQGVNQDVPREDIERWLAKNKTLAAVKHGDVRIIENDRMAVDSSKRK